MYLSLVYSWFWLQKRGEKRREIQKYENEIDDFRDWEDPAAARRLRGSIIRLNKLGISKINLSNCYLANLHLEEINFTDSDMMNVNLEGAFLEYADLSNTDSWSANFIGANLEYAKFINSEVKNSKFIGANLSNANFKNAKLNESDFDQVTSMFNANFHEADLRDVKNINPGKLLTVKTLYGALMNENLRKIIQRSKPQLFQEI